MSPKAPKEAKVDYGNMELCLFTIGPNIAPNEIVEAIFITPQGSISTLYCRREHDYSIRSVMRQLKLTSKSKIEIIKVKTIGQSFSSTIPFLGTTNIN